MPVNFLNKILQALKPEPVFKKKWPSDCLSKVN